MENEVKSQIATAQDKMEKAIQHLDKELIKIRAGKASANMLDGILVDYHGATTPLTKVANISVADARSITIQPWDKSVITSIEKAVLKANLGLTPENNGEVVRINVPPLTEERRKALVKQVKTESENSKVVIRNTRRDIIEEFKKLKKKGLDEDVEKKSTEQMQKIHDNYIKKVDELAVKKEKEIMHV